MAQYDEQVLQTYADRLYRQATWIVIKYAIVGIGLGVLIGYAPMVTWYWRQISQSPPDTTGAMVVCALLLGLIFSFIGDSRAFEYKLRAQTALCQMQIERNTRRTIEQARAQTAGPQKS